MFYIAVFYILGFIIISNNVSSWFVKTLTLFYGSVHIIFSYTIRLVQLFLKPVTLLLFPLNHLFGNIQEDHLYKLQSTIYSDNFTPLPFKLYTIRIIQLNGPIFLVTQYIDFFWSHHALFHHCTLIYSRSDDILAIVSFLPNILFSLYTILVILGRKSTLVNRYDCVSLKLDRTVLLRQFNDELHHISVVYTPIKILIVVIIIILLLVFNIW